MGFRIEAPKQDGNARFNTLKVNLNENNLANRAVVADEEGNFYYGTGGGGGTGGTNGTSGANGTSGTSGTGFNTISNPALNRVLLSDGSTNSAIASTNLNFSNNTLQVTGSLIADSLLINSDVFEFTGSLRVLGGITGSLYGTSSWAISAIQSDTASYVSSSNVYGPYGFDSIQTASFALTASSADSFVIRSDKFEFTGSLEVLGGITGSLLGTSSFAITASHALNVEGTASWAYNALTASSADNFYIRADKFEFTGSLEVNGGITGSLFGTSSWAVSASWAPGAGQSDTASYVSSSNVYGPYGFDSIQTASFAFTASSADSFTIRSDKFEFTGSLEVLGGITGSLLGTASYAPNIYNSNGQLTSDRSISASLYSLTINSLKSTGSTFIVSHLQTQSNATDTADIGMQVSYNISASSATNQLVSRAFQLSVFNNLTGGGSLQNLRCFNLAAFFSTGTTTDEADLVYLERGNLTGTISTYRAIRIANYTGTNRGGIAMNAIGGSGNAAYLNMGSVVIPSGRWGIYQSETAISNYFAGNFSIGTTQTGSYKLHVIGSTGISNGLTATGSIFFPSLTQSPENSVVLLNSSTGQLHYTASSALIPLTASYALTASSADGFTIRADVFEFTGSLRVSGGGITGSLLGTASFATTASYALNARSVFPFSGSAVITGSLVITGSSSSTTYLLDASGSSRLTTLHVQNLKNPAGFNGEIDVFVVGNPGDAGYQKLTILAGGSPYSTVLRTSGAGGGSRGMLLDASGPGGEMYFGTSDANRWLISGTYNVSGSGHIFPIGDGLYDIGNRTSRVSNYYGVRSYISNLLSVTGSADISASVAITGSLNVAGRATINNLTGSLFGTSSWAISSSFALTSSFINPTGSNAFVQGGNSFGTTALLGTNDARDLALETNGTVRMTISGSNGNVGIGTATPLQKLDVSGSTRSDIYFTNYGTSSINLLVSGQTPQISDRGIYIGSGTFNNASVVGVGIGSFINLGTGVGNVAIGYVTVANSGGVAIGSPGGVGASSDGGVALSGTTSNSARFAVMGSATAQGSISISSTVSQLNGIGIGVSSTVSAPHGVALGDRAVVGSSHTNSIAIGLFATTTAAKQLVIGGNDSSNNYAITDVYIGGGVQDLNLSNGTPVTINASGGNGTDKNGGSITIAGGKGTGTGTPGDIIFSTSTSTTSGTTLQSLTQRVWIKGESGNVGINTTNPSATLHVSGAGIFSGTADQILTLDATDSSWSYIGYSWAGSRRFYTGLDSAGKYVFGSDTGAAFYFSGASLGVGNTSPSTLLTVGNTSGDNGGITVLADNTSNTYDVFSGQRKYPRITLIDSISGGSTFQIWNLGNQLRFGTSAGSSTISAFNVNAGETGSVIFNGNVGIKTSGPSYTLDVLGTIRATGDVIAYSDARVKDNVVPIENALEKVVSLRGVSYTRKDTDDKSRKLGVIAQELLPIIPEVVSKDQHGNYSVSYGNIVGLLIEAIKEQQQQIEELKYLLKKE